MTSPSKHLTAHRETNQRLERHYNTLLQQHGDSPLAAQYPDRGTQEKRFEILSQIGIPAASSILDFGCGLGDALGYLRRTLGFTGNYVGYDLAEDVIAHARLKYRGDPGAHFERRDIFTTPPDEDFDVIWICGTFNIKGADSDAYIRDALRILFSKARRGLTFNLMSTYVDFLAPDLHYADPDAIFRFCKEELSPCVTLRHDYVLKPGIVPYEFAVYVYTASIKPRKNQMAQ